MREELIIEHGRIEKNYWRDLWHYRELFYILSWRDIKVRYKQTIIGVLWSVLRPLLTMVIFTIVFNRLAGMSSGSAAPYAIMVYAGMLPWQFFSVSLSDASSSLISNTNLISKVYFPRLIIPAASIITNLIDLFIAFLLLFGLYFFYGYMPDLKLFLLPLFILMAMAISLGMGLYITALNVKYRDFRYIIPFLIQFGLYISPVGFNSDVISGKWKLVYYLNPMASIIDGFRWCLLRGDQVIYWNGFMISAFVAIYFMWAGLRKFRRMEKSFADVI